MANDGIEIMKWHTTRRINKVIKESGVYVKYYVLSYVFLIL